MNERTSEPSSSPIQGSESILGQDDFLLVRLYYTIGTGGYLATKSMVGAGYSESVDKVYLPLCNHKGKVLCGLLRLGK